VHAEAAEVCRPRRGFTQQPGDPRDVVAAPGAYTLVVNDRAVGRIALIRP